MKKSKKSSRGFFRSNLLNATLIVVGMATVFVYDRTVWIANAQQKILSETASSSTAIQTCVNSTNGNVRVSDGKGCKKEEKEMLFQQAINGLVSDVEVVWYQPAGDRNTNYDSGVNIECPEGKVAIGGGSTEVVRKNVPIGEDILGGSGNTDSAKGWEIIPWRYESAPVVYAVCARVNN